MNKTTHYLRLALMAIVAAVTMASCTDDDTQQAYDLNGYWQGSIEGDYYSDRYGGYDSWGSRPEPSRTLWSDDDHTLRFAVVPEEVMSAERARQFRY